MTTGRIRMARIPPIWITTAIQTALRKNTKNNVCMENAGYAGIFFMEQAEN
jgi:hypothetical protein